MMELKPDPGSLLYCRQVTKNAETKKEKKTQQPLGNLMKLFRTSKNFIENKR